MIPAVDRIVDAGPLVGWMNQRDQWHAWSVATLRAGKGPLHTTEIVLGEACHLLGGTGAAVHRLLGYVAGGGLVLHRIWPEHLARCQELMFKREEMDLAAASLVVLSELHPAARLVSVDAHFRRYHRFRRQALPAVLPPPI